jgi:hypothetical protein
MGDVRVNLRSIVTIGLIGFVGVWGINRLLGYAGMSQYQA